MLPLTKSKSSGRSVSILELAVPVLRTSAGSAPLPYKTLAGFHELQRILHLVLVFMKHRCLSPLSLVPIFYIPLHIPGLPVIPPKSVS
ncbi:hypothetical protein DAEQUDRAFT_436702 [Daedalea quercina L-15889]|uniref:Uncharacterized protein n=1 Tax=Daedalea quercina L-15889 TaxID=1314783 RepID=A0A165NEI0_9APHY|nr:hypothetical protein DAEQUDRAFT_436702 [Daedalea quercina L-15889]